jgi:flagellar assembly protein FliH
VPRKIYKAGEFKVVDSKVLITPPRIEPKRPTLEEIPEAEPVYEEAPVIEEETVVSEAPRETAYETAREERKETRDELLEEARRIREEAEAEAERVRKEADDAAFKIVQKSNVDVRTAQEEAQSEKDRILREATEEAARVEEEANQKAQSIVDEAKRKAFGEGREEGYQSGKEEVDRLVERLHAVLNAAIDERHRIIDRTERQIIDLILMIVRKVVKVISENERKVVIENVKEALKKIKGDTEITIRVNTRDLNLTTKNKRAFIASVESLKQVHVEEDSRIEPGGCIIETSYGDIDARIQNQLALIEERIRELVPIGE